jgi:hypothetical protein
MSWLHAGDLLFFLFFLENYLFLICRKHIQFPEIKLSSDRIVLTNLSAKYTLGNQILDLLIFLTYKDVINIKWDNI